MKRQIRPIQPIQWKPLLLCLALPLAIGGLAALLSGGGMRNYAALRQPPLSPPGWAFPVAWTILYLLMGYASYRLLPRREDGSVLPLSAKPLPDACPPHCAECRAALRLYAAQLALNFLWPVLYFAAQLRLAALVNLLLLWALVLALLLRSRRCDRTAALLFAPYLAWLTFAAYLNFGTLLLNL